MCISGCDLLITAMICTESYSIDESDSCPASEPYECSEDGSCYSTYEDADGSCSEIASIAEDECWMEYGDSDSGSSEGGSTTTGDGGETETYSARKDV